MTANRRPADSFALRLSLPTGVLLVATLVAAALFASPAFAELPRLPGLAGGELTEADLAQGKTVVVVWAGWSPRCREIVERTNLLADRWRGSARVVAVNFQEERGAVAAFLADKSPRFPVYLDADGEFARAQAVTNLPGLVVFVDGAVVYRGKLPADPDALLADLLR